MWLFEDVWGPDVINFEVLVTFCSLCIFLDSLFYRRDFVEIFLKSSD